MKTVAAYSLVSETHAPLSRLHSAGIAAVVRDEHSIQFNWLWSDAIGGVKIEVPDDDYEAARELLGLKPTETGVIICPHCGSNDVRVRPLSVAAAVFMALKIPIPCSLQAVDCRSCGKPHMIHRAGKRH
jgi:hypothetical protein